MKHLKKFNEELYPSTYKSASNKLAEIGHLNRSRKLGEYSNKVREANNIRKMNSDINLYDKYGTFLAGNSDLQENYHLKLFIDDYWFRDNIGEFDHSGDGVLRIETSFIPVDVESRDATIEYLDKLMGTDHYLDSTYRDNYEFAGENIYIRYKLNEEGFLYFTEIDTYNDFDYGTYDFGFIGRESGVKLKKLLVKLFSDVSLDYPMGYSENVKIQDFIKDLFIENLNSLDFTWLKYGDDIKIGDIGNFIKTSSVNKLYKSI
jgi:hypothetical protein